MEQWVVVQPVGWCFWVDIILYSIYIYWCWYILFVIQQFWLMLVDVIFNIFRIIYNDSIGESNFHQALYNGMTEGFWRMLMWKMNIVWRESWALDEPLSCQPRINDHRSTRRFETGGFRWHPCFWQRGNHIFSKSTRLDLNPIIVKYPMSFPWVMASL